MNRRYNLGVFTSICILVFILSPAHLIIAKKEKTSTQREITADSLKWEYEKRIAVFAGNVIMKSKEGEITASKLTVFFNEEDEIEKMVGEENAGLIREKQKGGGEIIEIYPSQDLLILKQRAWISSDKALFKGEEITFDTAREIINITQGVKGEIQTGSGEKPMNGDTEVQSSKGTEEEESN